MFSCNIKSIYILLYFIYIPMKFTRTKKLVFFNNKWWVGKTTIAYNTAIKFASHGYKTLLIDLDPQCNLSRLSLWDAFAHSLFSQEQNNIYSVLQGVIQWWSDIRTDIDPIYIQENLSLIPWSLKLSQYEDLLITAYNQAAAWSAIGYFQTSALQRYIHQIGLDHEIDICIVDISPSLGLLNRIIMLGSDYFITPLMPDAFSVQGIENLWITFESRKKNRRNTGKALARDIPNEQVLNGEWLFLWYIINSYNQYAKQPIQSHQKRIEKIPEHIKTHISLKHCRNGLVEKSWISPLVSLKDYGELSADSQIANKAIFDLIPGQDYSSVPWTQENKELAEQQFEELFNNIATLLYEY